MASSGDALWAPEAVPREALSSASKEVEPGHPQLSMGPGGLQNGLVSGEKTGGHTPLQQCRHCILSHTLMHGCHVSTTHTHISDLLQPCWGCSWSAGEADTGAQSSEVPGGEGLLFSGGLPFIPT